MTTEIIDLYEIVTPPQSNSKNNSKGLLLFEFLSKLSYNGAGGYAITEENPDPSKYPESITIGNRIHKKTILKKYSPLKYYECIEYLPIPI